MSRVIWYLGHVFRREKIQGVHYIIILYVIYIYILYYVRKKKWKKICFGLCYSVENNTFIYTCFYTALMQ